MALFSKIDRQFVETISKMSFSNPFLGARIELEREALGDDFDPVTPTFWRWSVNELVERPNILKLMERTIAVANKTRQKLEQGSDGVTNEEIQLYDDLAHYVIYYEVFANKGLENLESMLPRKWTSFCERFEHWMNVNGRKMPCYEHQAHVFSYLSQLMRAFFNIFHCVVGRSLPIAMLRARIWESIFTHNLRRYRDSLYARMNEVTTLVIGPSGTGKELVARAVSLSGYLPFDEASKSFRAKHDDLFFGINLSALSPTLIESELFGHVKGSFTGATTNRVGYFEAAGKFGSVFLDEIGETDLAIQIKLLRVLQNRQFQRIGENKTLPFSGKILAATNRDLMQEIRDGKFREDFYYRLCSDIITTPTLAEQISDREDEFEFLVEFIANRIAPDISESLTEDVMTWIRKKMPRGYHWPGNMRELEQCVRNIMIHNDYHARQISTGSATDEPESTLASQIGHFELSADQLVGLYCKLAYEKTNSYEKAASLLKLDRRTVRAKIVALSEIESTSKN